MPLNSVIGHRHTPMRQRHIRTITPACESLSALRSRGQCNTFPRQTVPAHSDRSGTATSGCCRANWWFVGRRHPTETGPAPTRWPPDSPARRQQRL